MRIFFNFIKRLFSKKTKVEPVPVEVEIPVQANIVIGVPNLKLGKLLNTTPDEEVMVKKAIGYLEQVLSSSYFRDEVIAAKFTNTNNKTNSEIYEMYFQEINISCHAFTGSYWQTRVYHTMGYEDPSDDYVHFNRSLVRDAVTLASLILHEISHEPLGFSHNSSTEYSSVPYTMNKIAEKIMTKLGIK